MNNVQQYYNNPSWVIVVICSQMAFLHMSNKDHLLIKFSTLRNIVDSRGVDH